MTSRWEPLETAHDAVDALQKGRDVEGGMPGLGLKWMPTACSTAGEFAAAMARGVEYRVRIEGDDP